MPSADAARPPVRTIERIAQGLERVEDLCSVVAGGAIFVVMVVVFVDVFLRYFFRAPLAWSYDLIAINLIPLLFFFALSHTFRQNHHVAVDILYLRVSPRAQRLARLLIALLCLPVMLWMTALVAESTLAAWTGREVISGAVNWPTWVPSSIASLGFALLIMRLVLDALALALSWRVGSAEVPGESPARAAAPPREGGPA